MRFKIVDERTAFTFFYALYSKRWFGTWRYIGYSTTLKGAEDKMMQLVKPSVNVNYYNSDGSPDIGDLS